MRMISSFNELFGSEGVSDGVGTIMDVDTSDQKDIPAPTGDALNDPKEQSLVSLCSDTVRLLGLLSTSMESLVMDYNYRMNVDYPGSEKFVDLGLDDDDYLDAEEEEETDDDFDEGLSEDENDVDLFNARIKNISGAESESDLTPEEIADWERIVTQRREDIQSFFEKFRQDLVVGDKRLYGEIVSRIREIEKKIQDGYKEINKNNKKAKYGRTRQTKARLVAGDFYSLNKAQQLLMETELAMPHYFGKNAFKPINPYDFVKDPQLMKASMWSSLEKRYKECLASSKRQDNYYLSRHKS